MTAVRQQDWLADVLESAPSIVSLALWRSDMDGGTAAWTRTGLAAARLPAAPRALQTRDCSASTSTCS